MTIEMAIKEQIGVLLHKIAEALANTKLQDLQKADPTPRIRRGRDGKFHARFQGKAYRATRERDLRRRLRLLMSNSI